MTKFRFMFIYILPSNKTKWEMFFLSDNNFCLKLVYNQILSEIKVDRALFVVF